MGFLIIFLIVLAIVGIYLLLIMPRVFDRADMDLLLFDYAHRGLWNDIYPENSLGAFARAVEAGVGIELDIQLSKDKKIVVFHDYDLKRMCGINKKVSELTFEELQKIKLKGTTQSIPTLADVLKLVDGKVPLLIELKGEEKNIELCKRTATMLDKYHGAFCVESFNPLLLSWFKNFRPRYARGQLVTNKIKKTKKGSSLFAFSMSNLFLNCISRPDFIAVDGRMRKRPAIYICNKIFKAKIFVWTVRTKREYEISQKEGFHAIFEKFLP